MNTEIRFSPEQLEQFRTQGYVAVPDFWSPEEVAAMRAELERFKAEGLLRNVATEGDGQTESQQKANLQLCPMSPHSRLFKAMPFAPQVGAAIEQLLGETALLQLDQVFLKPGQHGAGTSWHQDNHYFGIRETTQGTAIWTAVHDAHRANGTMRLIPQAFHEALEHTRDGESDHHFRCFPDESKAVTIELPAGGALFFNYGTPHATGANTTPDERAGIALHFLTKRAREQSKFGSELRAYPVVCGPDASAGEAEYGEKMDWRQEVAHINSR